MHIQEGLLYDLRCISQLRPFGISGSHSGIARRHEGRLRILDAALTAIGPAHEPGVAPKHQGFYGTSSETPRCPLKESFKGDIRPYKGYIELFWYHLEAHGT